MDHYAIYHESFTVPVFSRNLELTAQSVQMTKLYQAYEAGEGIYGCYETAIRRLRPLKR